VEGVRAFEQGQLPRARSLLRGRFLGNFELAESREVNEWRESQDAAFRRYYSRATRELANRALTDGNAELALELAQELVAADPMLEENIRLLMTVLESSGNETGALARYSEYAALMKAALGDAPSAKLQAHAEALEQRLRTKRDALTASRPAAESSGADRHQMEREAIRIELQRRDRRRWMAWSSGALALASVALVIGVQTGASRDRARLPLPDGWLYVAHDDSTVPDRGRIPVVFRVNWPHEAGERGQVEPITTWPADLPPQLVTFPVSDPTGTHLKVYLIRGRDTTQVTFGPTDDGPAMWSPDRRLIAVQRAWRVADSYRFNLFVSDSTGHEWRPLTTGPHQDFLVAWSPDGSRLAFQRVANGRKELWSVDSDGGHVENLTARFSLPDGVTAVAFSPDGLGLAATVVHSQAVELLDLTQNVRRSLPIGCRHDPSFVAWSPDGRWLALACQEGIERSLMLLTPNGLTRYDGVAALGSHQVHALGWVDNRPRYIDRIEIGAESLALETGRGRRIRAGVIDAGGAHAVAPLRWSVGDTTVASVDQLGFLRGRRPGRTWVSASAGGFRADTAIISIVPAAVDTLLYESWTTGIRADRWQVVGTPAPSLVAAAAPDGRSAFLSNGDYNWPSGVLSLQEFPTEEGLTLELPAWFEFTGAHWQELEVALVPRSRALGASERAVGGRTAWWEIAGPSPRYVTRQLACGSDQAQRTIRGDSLPLEERRWHRLTLQLRPDGILECYHNGQKMGSLETPLHLRTAAVAVYLGGRTYKTRILHGPTLLVRGMLY
jgi:hypothetical protein